MTLKETLKKFIPRFLLKAYHLCWSFFGALVFSFPGYSKNIKIIGVTGTSGKSTTCDFIARILTEAGHKVASISTIRFKVGEQEWENKYKMTMPGRFVIQKFLSQARKAGCQFVVLEVSSQGIEQFRHKFINFDCAVFTNLSPEHIESHGSFENYRNEKLKLFRACKNIHVINADDKNAGYFLGIPAKKIITFSAKSAQNINLKLNLFGDFNILNAMAAISVAEAYKISLETCRQALEKIKQVPGRMEIIQEKPFKVIVDYAHTPEQLESVYKSFSGKKLICVLGSCGGGRDKWKRPVLGQIAQKYCQKIILTNEDPYDENPLSIVKQIEGALSDGGADRKYQIILDRKEAIRKAIEIAKPGEIVVITGKGSEPWMCVANGKKIPWDDRQVVRDVLKK